MASASQFLREHRHRALVLQFLRFGVVGGGGFVVDTAVVYALRGLVGVYWAGALAYPVAASFTWGVNRVWTFRGQSTGAVHRQWAIFLVTNLLGFVLNRGVYFALVASSPFVAANPVVAVAAGAVAGMFVNFFIARQVVFK